MRTQGPVGKAFGTKPLPFIVLSEEYHPGAQDWLKGVCRRAGYSPRIAHAVDRAPTLLSCVGWNWEWRCSHKRASYCPTTESFFVPSWSR